MSEAGKEFVITDDMIKSRLEVLEAEEGMLRNMGVAPHPHIEWERGLIARLNHVKQQLDHQVDRIVSAKENMSLRSCKKCSHLHMNIHVCYMCGYDDSIPDDEQP